VVLIGAIAAAVLVFAVVAGLLMAKFLRGDPATPEVDPGSIAGPPVTPLPVPETPPSTPAPIPTTAGGRALPLTEVAALVGKGRPAEKLYLVGELKVTSAQPPGAGNAPMAVLRPADAALYATMRVRATYLPGTPLPQEGSTIRWSETDRWVVRNVTRGEDGQINAEIEAER
jgi:hypothetical protein